MPATCLMAPPQPHVLSYRGRFAPSPSGPLHLGSLVSALASFLDAKANNGHWLLRIEDIDPPREQAGATTRILKSLEAHHLYWDEPVLYQSQRLHDYDDVLALLSPYTYPCGCTRKRLASLNGLYDGLCRSGTEQSITALRLRVDAKYSITDNSLADLTPFDDVFLGQQNYPLKTLGDVILKRKDGLIAYQLAVAVDDHFQNISHVIRGYDLLSSTNWQRYILALLDKPIPKYGHTPLVMKDAENKLSKQTGAAAIEDQYAFANLCKALSLLGHTPPKAVVDTNDIDDLLNWGALHWQRKQVPLRQSEPI